jgi:phosphopantetheine adenylyltransferase
MNLTNIEIYETNQILDKSAYNGRVNIVEAPSPEVQFKMQERIAIKNKTTEYREAIAGDLESNLLATVYFSAANIQIIQNGLRAGVYKMSNDKYVIAPQNMDTLKIIMRSIFLQYAEFDMNNITKEVSRLNNMVLDYAVQSVYNEAVGYMKYCEDQSTLAVPLELPQQVDREFKQLEMKPFV